MDKPKNFLVITGIPGVGKTYACAAMIPWIIENFHTFRVWKEDEFFRRVRQVISDRSGDYIAEIQYLMDDQIIVYDDLGVTPPNEWREEVLYEMVDYRYRLKQPTVFTTNLTEEELKQRYNYRISSRVFAKENYIINLHNYENLREQGK